jgi:hypothetical protein
MGQYSQGLLVRNANLLMALGCAAVQVTPGAQNFRDNKDGVSILAQGLRQSMAQLSFAGTFSTQ